MAYDRRRLNWLYDDTHQQFTTPPGRTVTLQEIAQLLQNQITCTHDFPVRGPDGECATTK